MVDVINIILLVVIVLLILALVGILVHHSLPHWQANPGSFMEDMKTVVFAGWMSWLGLGFFPVLFLFFAPATQAEFNLGIYIAIPWFLSILVTAAVFG